MGSGSQFVSIFELLDSQTQNGLEGNSCQLKAKSTKENDFIVVVKSSKDTIQLKSTNNRDLISRHNVIEYWI